MSTFGINTKLEKVIYDSGLPYSKVSELSGVSVWKLRDARQGRGLFEHEREAFQKVLNCSKKH